MTEQELRSPYVGVREDSGPHAEPPILTGSWQQAPDFFVFFKDRDGREYEISLEHSGFTHVLRLAEYAPGKAFNYALKHTDREVRRIDDLKESDMDVENAVEDAVEEVSGRDLSGMTPEGIYEKLSGLIEDIIGEPLDEETKDLVTDYAADLYAEHIGESSDPDPRKVPPLERNLGVTDLKGLGRDRLSREFIDRGEDVAYRPPKSQVKEEEVRVEAEGTGVTNEGHLAFTVTFSTGEAMLVGVNTFGQVLVKNMKTGGWDPVGGRDEPVGSLWIPDDLADWYYDVFGSLTSTPEEEEKVWKAFEDWLESSDEVAVALSYLVAHDSAYDAT